MRTFAPALRVAAVLLFIAGCARTPVKPSPGATSESVVPRRRVPNPVLRAQDDRSLRFYDDVVKDRVVVLTFVYTRCTGSCPRTTDTLVTVQKLVQEKLGRDVQMVALSLDPENDTPAALRRFAEMHRATEGWTFLTGEAASLDTLRRSLGFTDPDPAIDADFTQHAAMVAFGNDRTGRWAAVPAGIGPEQIAEAIVRIAGPAAVPATVAE